MGKVNMVRNIKEIHPRAVILLKVGAFCEAYGRDSYILSYLFGYQVKQKGNNDIPKTGFSKKALPKVLSRLEEEKIDFSLNFIDKIWNMCYYNYSNCMQYQFNDVLKRLGSPLNFS